MTWAPLFRPGDRVGALTVLAREGKTKSGCAIWLTQCDCGNSLSVSTERLSTRGTRSCGCLPLAPRPSGHKPRTRFPSQQELVERLNYAPDTGIFRWKAHASPYSRGKIGGVAGSKDANGYVIISLDRVSYKAHHLAWIYVHGAMHSMPQTDHKDGDGCNNAIANLRPCSFANNQANQRTRNKMGLPKGVKPSKRGKPFTARIRFQKRLLHIGAFDTVDEAAQAYLEAAKRLYGEFARQDWAVKP